MLLIEVLDAPAWRALSHGAKVLYIALRRRYHATIDNNGIYLPQRTAEKELHSHRDQIARWFRELEHYGFHPTEISTMRVHVKFQLKSTNRIVHYN